MFFNGQLYLGMMWRSKKIMDLLRDPRRCVHNAVSDRMAPNGARAVDIANPPERQEYLKALFQKIGDQPVGHKFHRFAIDIESAAATTLVDEEFQHQV